MLQKQNGVEQANMHHVNTNDIEILSTEEAELLNSLLEKLRDDFDFHDKKVAFITGSSGSHILSRTEYFASIHPWIVEGATPQISMLELTLEEKKKSGGYDVFVLSWVKIFTEKQKRNVIEKLAKK